MINKDIPDGDYCYRITTIETLPSGYPKINIKYCTHYHTKTVCEVAIPYCDFLGKMGYPDCTDEEYEKLLEFYKSCDKIDEVMPLNLLWDGCKCCGVNK